MYKHGEKRTWDLAIEAVEALGGKASRADIEQFIVSRYPNYTRTNLNADLCAVSVNCKSRGHYHQNSKPRRTDTGSEFDRLFRQGSGRSILYEIYDPRRHGVWSLIANPEPGMRPPTIIRPVTRAWTEEEVQSAAKIIEGAGDFDPKSIEDARQKTLAAVVRRQGQPAFRHALLEAYGYTCVVTGCGVEAVLEAAHIHPYRGTHTNTVTNGLLLRADIHALFDCGWLGIHPQSRTVLISPSLDGSEYAAFRGKVIAEPRQKSSRPSDLSLAWHFEQFGSTLT